MQKNKWILFLLAMVIGQTVEAQVDTSPLLSKKKPPPFDLLKESDSLQVLKEQPVQVQPRESRHVLTVQAGMMDANSLTLASNGQVIHYDLSQPVPIIGGQMGYFPAFLGAAWGLQMAVNYSYREQSNPLAPTALHLFNGDCLLSYRYEKDTHAWLKPFAGIGPGLNIVDQRGIDVMNTSEEHGLIVGALGVGFNVKRLFDFDSPLDWELNLQYKRWIEPNVSNADFNGDLLTLGISAIL